MTALEADDVKRCCALAYESPWARFLLGDSFHPGGMRLTERLGKLLELGPGREVLDVASGLGTSAMFLARAFGCQVTGVDLGEANVLLATAIAEADGLSEVVRFQAADAERLPFAPASFDALLCECAFCTFPSKGIAAAEFARVVRPGGLVAISDLTRNGPLAPELETLLGWVACMADAQPLGSYVACLEEAGFEIVLTEDRSEVLRDLLRSVRLKLLGAEVAIKLGKLRFSLDELRTAKDTARAAGDAISRGQLGYGIVVARRSELPACRSGSRCRRPAKPPEGPRLPRVRPLGQSEASLRAPLPGSRSGRRSVRTRAPAGLRQSRRVWGVLHRAGAPPRS